MLSDAMQFTALPPEPEPAPPSSGEGAAESHGYRNMESAEDKESTLDVEMSTDKDGIRVFSIANKWIKNVSLLVKATAILRLSCTLMYVHSIVSYARLIYSWSREQILSSRKVRIHRSTRRTCAFSRQFYLGVRRLMRVLEYHGVFRELSERHGAREGDCFSIGAKKGILLNNN